MYALLLNHCVYVATVARLEDARIADLARQLIVCLPEGRAWSYRLDDTLGYYYYVRAATTLLRLYAPGDARLEPTGPELMPGLDGTPHLISSARKDVREAERWFNRVPDDVADPEVTAHRALLRELEVELDGVRLATSHAEDFPNG
jgi:hypothetical protein